MNRPDRPVPAGPGTAPDESAEESLVVLVGLAIKLAAHSRAFAAELFRREPVTDPAARLSRLAAELAPAAARLDELRAAAGDEQ
ncbi:hypothetical protein [Streptomyces nojiriensis]|uniref:hypothetical protein n=1 Tax=Streptomyces nojiriensis TaxID=66374 RepID=UPI0036606E6F